MTATDIARAAGRPAVTVAKSETGIDGAAPVAILACPPRLAERFAAVAALVEQTVRTLFP